MEILTDNFGVGDSHLRTNPHLGSTPNKIFREEQPLPIVADPQNYRALSPDFKRVDQVENVTLQIFLNLHAVADRLVRVEVEEFVEEAYEKDPEVPKAHRFHPFRRENHFFEKNFEEPPPIKNVIRNIFSALGSIFLGFEFAHSRQDPRDPDQMIRDLREDRSAWDVWLSRHYTQDFHLKMQNAFRKAGLLLKDRQDRARKAAYHRLFLVVTAILAIVAEILGKRGYALLGAGASAVTLLFMAVQYGATTFRETHQGNELKRLLEIAVNEAARNRLDNPKDLFNFN